jgi:colanic acid/amylovoran biosynthesis protein
MLNGGDAAILAGQLATLRQAFGAVDVTIFDQQADVSSRYYPELGLRPALFWLRAEKGAGRSRNLRWGTRMVRLLAAAIALRAGRMRGARWLCPSADDFQDLRAYAGADVVLTPGGTMLVAQYQYLPRLVDYAAALVLGRPLILFTQSLGPFRGGVHRKLLAAVLRRARLILVRGEESKVRVAELGVRDERCQLAPDAAFMLAERHSPDRGDGPLRIALSLREWPFFRTSTGQQRYEAALAEMCTWLVSERGAEITCVSTCQGTPEYWMDDAATADRMVTTLADDVRASVTVDHTFHRAAQLRDRYGTFDLVVATRFHASILSLCAGTPVVAIEYERKATEAFAEMGLAEWVVEIEQLDGAALIAVVDRMLGRLAEVRRQVADAVAAEAASAEAVAVRLRDALSR